MSRANYPPFQNDFDNNASLNEQKHLFLTDLKKTQGYIQNFSASTQQLLKIAVKDDFSNPNIVRLLHQVMALVYDITKWVYTLMKRDETPNEHCMKLLDKVAKQAATVVEAFKHAVISEDKSANTVFLTRFMGLTELIHKVLDDFLIYGNPLFLNAMKLEQVKNQDTTLIRKSSDRRGSVGPGASLNQVPSQLDKRRASTESPLSINKPELRRVPTNKEYDLPKRFDDELKRSSSDIEEIHKQVTSQQASPLHQEVIPSLPEQKSHHSSRRSSHDSPKASPRLSRKPDQIAEEQPKLKFNEFLSINLPAVHQARDRRSLSNPPTISPSEDNFSERRFSQSTLRNSSLRDSSLGYISPAQLGILYSFSTRELHCQHRSSSKISYYSTKTALYCH